MTDTNILVETRELTKVYGNGNEVVALDHVNFTIEHGEYLAVMGPSGSGKSTLLNMLGALDLPSSGQVFVNGQDLAKVKDLDRFRARTVGFIFQLHNLLPTLSALENVIVPMQGQPGSSREHREWAEHLMETRWAWWIAPITCPASSAAASGSVSRWRVRLPTSRR